MSTAFFKDHLKTYKKRPIYWLFSSGKQKAFECLVYLHRYNESTLSRMRSTYVTLLQSNFSSRLEFLQDEKYAASTESAKNRFQKEMDKLQKKQVELSKFDDELRHYTDIKISLELMVLRLIMGSLATFWLRKIPSRGKNKWFHHGEHRDHREVMLKINSAFLCVLCALCGEK